MLLSKPVGYAVRALVHLAQHQDDGPQLNARIAEEQAIPGPFLIKILSSLTTAGYVSSVRGPGGGFTLRRDPATIRLLDVLNVFEGFGLTEECLLGNGICSDETPCHVHRFWTAPKAELMEFLESTTIHHLAFTESKSRKTVKSRPSGRR